MEEVSTEAVMRTFDSLPHDYKLKDGDRIRIDATSRQVVLEVPDRELAARRAASEGALRTAADALSARRRDALQRMLGDEAG